MNAGHQVLVFLNRRGFASTLLCHDCGWTAECKRCDARLTYHQQSACLCCHHCDYRQGVPATCDACGGGQLLYLGQGTQRGESTLEALFPDTPIIRIDRDSTRRKHAMSDYMAEINSGKPCILVGTQMLAKGHHLPHLGLVAILDVDQGLYSPDFRASERMGQLVIQVAGRAGRESRRGTTWIQTHRPDHAWLRQLLDEGYAAFARSLLDERRQANWPPFSRLALLRAQASSVERALAFLAQIPNYGSPPPDVHLLGPVPAPMTRRAGAHRAQLLLMATSPAPLHHYLDRLIPQLSTLPQRSGVRWSLDVDPQDLF
ncbi:MAG TPA: primosomal protein N' [Gammaproteobacteria bacterium]|nr:primosomal protein N' [Gammaproteobacteria bacterium]